MKQNVQTAKNVLARLEFVSCAVSKYIKSEAANSDTALGNRAGSAERLRWRWNHVPRPDLQLVKLTEPHKQVGPNESLEVISISL